MNNVAHFDYTQCKQKGFAPIVIIAIIAVIAVAGGGYFITQKQVIKTEDGIVAAEKKGDVVKISDNGGDWTITEGKLPANFPKNLPIYPKSKIVSSSIIEEKDNKDAGASVILETTGDPSSVYKWYKTEMEKLGWKFTVGNPTDPIGASGVFVNSTQGASISIIKIEGGKVQISLSSSSNKTVDKSMDIRDESGNKISAEEAAKQGVQTLREMEQEGIDTEVEFGDDTQGSFGEE